MARINIEERWWSSPRRNKLIRLFKGDSRLADGLALQAWRMSQDFCTSKFLIPMAQFSCLEDFAFLFDCDLAILPVTDSEGNPHFLQAPSKHRLDLCPSELQASLVYIRGSNERHEWLIKNQWNASLGGKKSATRPRDEKGRLLKLPEKAQAPSKHRLDPYPSDSKSLPLTPPPPLTPPLAQSQAQTLLNIKNPEKKYSKEFDDLWLSYDRKGDKKAAFKVWQGIRQQDRLVLTKAVTNYKNENPDRQFRKDLERFLKTDWHEKANQPLMNGFHKKTTQQIRQEQNDAVIAHALAKSKEAKEGGIQ